MTEKQRLQGALRQRKFRDRREASRRLEQASKGLPSLPSISTMAGHSRWLSSLSSCRLLVQQVCVEMSDYYASRSEAWQEGERGVAFAERQEAVESVLSELEELTI